MDEPKKSGLPMLALTYGASQARVAKLMGIQEVVDPIPAEAVEVVKRAEIPAPPEFLEVVMALPKPRKLRHFRRRDREAIRKNKDG